MKRRPRLAVVAAVVTVALLPAAWTLVFGAPGMRAVDQIHDEEVALVLGAGLRKDGRPSRYLEARLDIARQLYADGRVKVVLVSGDHGRVGHDEPTAMTQWLTEHGVKAEHIVQDHAGFDTYDSCVRAKRIFGVDRLVVVSQNYHLPRAISICRAVGVAAVGVGDDRMRHEYPVGWTLGAVRETVSDWKMTYDLVSRRDPVLGSPEPGVRDVLARR